MCIVGYICNDGDIWFNGLCNYFCFMQIDFFLYGIDNIQVVWQFYVVFFNQVCYFSDIKFVYMIVQCMAYIVLVVEDFYFIFVGNNVIDMYVYCQYFFFVFSIDINENIIDFWCQFGVFIMMGMNCWLVENILYNIFFSMDIDLFGGGDYMVRFIVVNYIDKVIV